MLDLRRRQLITLLGGAAAAWPLTGRAQQTAMLVIGLLNSWAPDDSPQLLAAFRQGLTDTGFVEGRNVAIEYRFAENRNERLPALAADLVHRQVTVIATAGPGGQGRDHDHSDRLRNRHRSGEARPHHQP